MEMQLAYGSCSGGRGGFGGPSRAPRAWYASAQARGGSLLEMKRAYS